MGNSFWSAAKEYAGLLGLKLAVSGKNFLEFLKVVFRYYGDLTFCKIDLYLLSLYWFNNPFNISKRYMQRIGAEDIHVYGETPLTTLNHIAHQCRINKDDVLFELGCGRGRNCFWLNRFIGCKTVGIEYIPEFIERANRVKSKFRITDVEFLHKNILDDDYHDATIIYVYGTCFEEPFIKKLIEKFCRLPPGTKIITVSYPLTDYLEENDKNTLEVMKRFSAPFTWGIADVYLQIRK